MHEVGVRYGPVRTRIIYGVTDIVSFGGRVVLVQLVGSTVDGSDDVHARRFIWGVVRCYPAELVPPLLPLVTGSIRVIANDSTWLDWNSAGELPELAVHG